MGVEQAVLAQLVERMAFNHVVVGSIPTDGAVLVFYFYFLYHLNLIQSAKTQNPEESSKNVAEQLLQHSPLFSATRSSLFS